ncbi:hypothetical protein SAMN04489724_4347 [Algoriphagus locisalis]|uniref:Uncharacterized protein n=1 Tax=Algoriphagus locisalis TaxID=305507 RepID=A0A1I7DTP6_9BACT|nr:hypothetical protein SAMN04489724_4347 [Algoriphagus locisalis]
MFTKWTHFDNMSIFINKMDTLAKHVQQKWISLSYVHFTGNNGHIRLFLTL